MNGFGRREFFSFGFVGVAALVGTEIAAPSSAKAASKRQPFNMMYNGSFEEFSSPAVAGWTFS
jgi:hypothetical protein